MDLLIIAGFLGSGKTTVLCGLVKEILKTEPNKKIAIIENEIGKTGIDDKFLREEKLPVKEIYSGCICCSLRGDLISTLLDLERNEKPDLVILEPSGVAGPKKVLNALIGYGGEINSKFVLGLIDAERAMKIRDFSMPLFANTIEVANLILLNKADLVSPITLEKVDKKIKEVQSDVPIKTWTATQSNPAELLSVLNNFWKQNEKTEDIEIEDNSEKLPAGVFSSEITLEDECDLETLENNKTTLLQNIVKKISEKENALIGHIKMIIQTKPTGYKMISITNENAEVTKKGKLPKTAKKVTITTNAIVYNMKKAELEDYFK